MHNPMQWGGLFYHKKWAVMWKDFNVYDIASNFNFNTSKSVSSTAVLQSLNDQVPWNCIAVAVLSQSKYQQV